MSLGKSPCIQYLIYKSPWTLDSYTLLILEVLLWSLSYFSTRINWDASTWNNRELNRTLKGTLVERPHWADTVERVRPDGTSDSEWFSLQQLRGYFEGFLQTLCSGIPTWVILLPVWKAWRESICQWCRDPHLFALDMCTPEWIKILQAPLVLAVLYLERWTQPYNPLFLMQSVHELFKIILKNLES